MYLDMLRWRDDWSVDSIYRHFEFKERDAFREAYPQGYHGVDREGRPIFINKPGRLDLKRVLQVTTPDRVLRSHIQQYEYLMREILPACSRLYGHRVIDTFNIMDVKGLGLGHLTGEVKHVRRTGSSFLTFFIFKRGAMVILYMGLSASRRLLIQLGSNHRPRTWLSARTHSPNFPHVQVITVTTKVTQDAYPETTGKLLVINAPWVFKARQKLEISRRVAQKGESPAEPVIRLTICSLLL